MLLDFNYIRSIIGDLDHQNLNEILPTRFLPPTAENIAEYLAGALPLTYRVRVWESDNAYAEVEK